MPAETVSACLIVQDEAERLPACLESIGFCDEVVVVDGGSRDATIAIARAAGARVIENPWPGYAAQRNVALDAATSAWVLEIDADERVTPPLAAEIRAFLTGPPAGVTVVALPLRHRFLGRPLGPAGHYPLYRRRLLRRGRVRHDESRLLHEGLAPPSGIGHFLSGDIEHILADSLGESLADARRYSSLQARALAPPQHPGAYVVGIVVRPLAKLVWRLVVSGAWHDGPQGALLVTIEAAADAAVWARLLGRRLGGAGDPGERPAVRGHFAQPPRFVGPPHLVAVADRRNAAVAQAWARGVADCGAAVSLVCPAPGSTRVVSVPRIGLFHVIRALEAERERHAIDLVVGFGSIPNALLRLLPRAVTSAARPRDGARLGPADALRHARGHAGRADAP